MNHIAYKRFNQYLVKLMIQQIKSFQKGYQLFLILIRSFAYKSTFNR